jgi:hypothetical protein
VPRHDRRSAKFPPSTEARRPTPNTQSTASALDRHWIGTGSALDRHWIGTDIGTHTGTHIGTHIGIDISTDIPSAAALALASASDLKSARRASCGEEARGRRKS